MFALSLTSDINILLKIHPWHCNNCLNPIKHSELSLESPSFSHKVNFEACESHAVP